MERMMRIHSYLQMSKVNGPGTRFVLWTQGCHMRCPGCFNPETHDPDAGEEMTTFDILALVSAVENEIEGITISGGEPFEQDEALFALLYSFKTANPRMNVVVFTGYDIEKLRENQQYAPILECIDMLVAGPYKEELKVEGDGLCASKNQKVVLLNETFAGRLIQGGVECVIDEETGDMTCTGFPFGELLNDEI